MTTGVVLPAEEDVCLLVSEVWASFLGTEISPSPEQVDAATAARNDVLSSVSITGAWSGHLLLGFDTAAAADVARSMFGLDAGEASQAEMTDAVGELANIIAGNIKSMLPEPSTLSLPQVVVDAQAIVLPSAVLRVSTALRWDEHAIVVSLWEAASSRGRSI